jgi:hypothetical protein
MAFVPCCCSLHNVPASRVTGRNREGLDPPVTETTQPSESLKNTGKSEDTKEAILSIKGAATLAIESEAFRRFSNSLPVRRTNAGF